MNRARGFYREVLRVFDAHPDWSSSEIAVYLNMSRRSGGGYVRCVLGRHGRRTRRKSGLNERRPLPWLQPAVGT